MKVSEAMTRDIRVASPEETVQKAAQTTASRSVVSPKGNARKQKGLMYDRDVKYCFEDQDSKRSHAIWPTFRCGACRSSIATSGLVAIISLGDIAISGGKCAGDAVHEISLPGGEHTQSG